MNNAFVYFHINPVKNKIFYVGISSKKLRPFNKINRTLHWKNTVKKYGYIVDIIETDLTWQQACEREKFYIKKIGRKDLGKGNLINLTNGGEGTLGAKFGKKIHSKEALKIMSEARKLNNPGGFKNNNKCNSWKDKKHTEETLLKMSESRKINNPGSFKKGYKQSPEHKQRIAESKRKNKIPCNV